ncbi:MAG: ROK family protein [Lewinellaceae bacterium]|nr:ROK family protein [Phaeodactylibacter sp.]MCB9036246.1 ROK family protein [Lewinellaceae bacterium]
MSENTTKGLAIGVDIGGGHILSAAVDIAGKIILEDSRSYVHVNNKGSLEEIMQAWARCINQSLSGIGPSRINGIGFAMPGPFNYRTGMAMFEGNDKYEALYEVSIADELKPWLNLGQEVELRFMNDATSFAVGCAWAGEASKYERAVALTLGTGMGSAFIEKGIPIVNRADVAPHGSLWHLPVREGIADDYFSTRWFVKNYNARFGASETGVKAIAEAARAEPEARALFVEFGRNLGNFLAPWLKKFSAQAIVLGGNVTGAYDLFGEPLSAALAGNGLDVSLEISNLKEDAALLGSARLFEATFWDAVKNDLPTL